MSGQASCLDGISFSLHEHLRNIRLLPKPLELNHDYDVTNIQSFSYDDTDEEIFVGKCRAKRDILLKQQELIAQQKQQHQSPQCLQLQSPELLSSRQTENLHISLPPDKIPDATDQTCHTSSINTAISQPTQNLNLNITYDILIPDPVNKFETQNIPASSENLDISQQMQKIDLKDFESEQDPFENLSLKVINDIEELDKVFYGAVSSATNPTTDTSNTLTTQTSAQLATHIATASNFTPTATIVDNLYKPQTEFKEIPGYIKPLVSDPTLTNNANFLYNPTTVAYNNSNIHYFTTPNVHSIPNLVHDQCQYLAPITTNSTYNNVLNYPTHPLYNQRSTYGNVGVLPDWNANIPNQFLITDNVNVSRISNNFSDINRSFIPSNNSNYLPTTVDSNNSSIADNYYYKKYVINKNKHPSNPNTLPSAPSPPTAMRQAKSTSDLTKLNDNDSTTSSIKKNIHSNEAFTSIKDEQSGVGNVMMGVHNFVKKDVKSSMHGRFTPPPPSKSSNRSFIPASAFDKPIQSINSNYPNHNEQLILKITRMGFPKDNVVRAFKEYGSDESKVVNHLCTLSALVSKGHDANLVQDVLFRKPDYNRAQVTSYLKTFKNFQNMGFPAENIHRAMKVTESDQEMILDILTSTST